MGSSLAAGYVTPQGAITTLAERAGFRAGGLPRGRARRRMVGRPRRGRAIFLAAGRGAAAGAAPASNCRRRCRSPAKLEQVQGLMAAGDERAPRGSTRPSAFISATPSRTTPDFYDVRNLLVLGRVMTGEGGDVILAVAASGSARRVSGTGRAHPLPHPGREGEAARAGHRRRQPARHSQIRRRHHADSITHARTFSFPTALRRRRGARAHHAPVHLGAPGRYRDHGLPRRGRVLRPPDKWFTGVVVTNGAGSPRAGIYGDYTDEQMQQVRLRGAAQGGLRGRLRLPDPARLSQLAR